jgi:hypothetical protein
MYSLHSPTLGIVPWPPVFQNGRRFGSWPWARPRLEVSDQHYLKPLQPVDTQRLRSRPLEDIPFLEDYSVPWGWKCLQPFWYARPSLEYLKLIVEFWKHGDPVIPHFVGATRASGSRRSVARTQI